MRVILRQDIRGIGKKHEVKELADGYVKNMLLPKGLVEPVTAAGLARVTTAAQKRAAETAAREERFRVLLRTLGTAAVDFHLRTDAKGTVFGSVTKEMLLQAMRAKGWLGPERVTVVLEHPIKTIGDHEVAVVLSEKLQAKLTVRVRSQP